MQEQLDAKPLQLCGRDMKQETEAKYLGDWLSSFGLSASVDVTIKKRKGLTYLAIYDIRAVIEDCRSMVCGGIKAGIDIWEAAVLPKLLFNSSCWLDISTPTMQELESLQLDFYRCLLAVGSGCPIPSLYWETGGFMMKYRILQAKLLLLHHIATLPGDSLAREMYEVQKDFRFPGLLLECEDFLTDEGVLNLENYTPFQWKNLVKTNIYKLNRSEILEQMKPLKKISYKEHISEKCQLQPYMTKLNIAEARLKFKLKTRMTPTVRMNFQSDPEFASKLWTCPGCTAQSHKVQEKVEGRRDTQAHILTCAGYAQFREHKDLTDDKDLTKYFSQVIQQRMDDNT